MSVIVEQGMQAHFFQPDGTSRPGTEWIVSIDGNARAFVRSYADDTAGLTTDDEAAAIIAFVESKLASGWRPTAGDEPLVLAKPSTGWPGLLGLDTQQQDAGRQARQAGPAGVAGARYWFPAKRYGWGWGLPATWQGWAVLIGWLLLVTLGSIVIAPRSIVGHVAFMCAAAAGLIAVCYAKGEPPRWRWGE